MITILGSTPLSAVLGSGVDNKNHDAVRAFIRSAADIGLSLLFIYPDSKVPADLRTTQQRKKDDTTAQEAAREAGRRDWAKVKSPAGLALATSDKTVLDRYLKRYIELFSTWTEIAAEDAGAAESWNQPDGTTIWLGETVAYSKKRLDAGEIVMQVPAAVNLAVEVGGSGLIVVDCDTAAQMERFYQVALPEGFPVEDRPAPTVITPGSVGDGYADDVNSWNHADGGHFYFTVPDELMPTLPRNTGAMTWGGGDGFAVLWDRRYVLIPPSTRPEGAYELLGRDYEAEDWLIHAITEAANRRLERATRHNNNSDEDATSLSSAIDDWAEATPWSVILEPLGWTPAPRADSCGCPVWTAPGPHASPKSATAHDSGCTAGRYTVVNAPLHLWTDHDATPFSDGIGTDGWTPTFSKLQAVALIHYGGGVGAAMDDIGLTPDLGVEGDPDIAPRAQRDDPDHQMTGDGDFELPDPREFLAERGRLATEPVEPDHHCVPCGTNLGLFVNDPDTGELWHAIDEDDASETGGHRADGTDTEDTHLSARIVDAPVAGTLTHERTGPKGKGISDRLPHDASETGGHRADGSDGMTPELADALSLNNPHLPIEENESVNVNPADLPADFGKKADRSGSTNHDSPYQGRDGEETDPDVFDSKHSGVPRIAPFSHWRDMPPPEYVIDGLIEHGGLSSVIGSAGIGKSTVVLDMACHIATGKRWQGRQTLKTKVLYLPGEGLSGAVQRLRAWEAAHDMNLDHNLLLGDSIILVQASNEAWGDIAAYIARQEIGLVIFDTFARMASGLEENSATDVGRAVRRFDKLKELTNAGVLVVHHTGKGNPNTGRGSSALNGALDSELIVRPAQWDTTPLEDDNGRMTGRAIELWTSKQKNAEQIEDGIPLVMLDISDVASPLLDGIEAVRGTIKAPVITGPNGMVDPMQGDVVLARPRPEPIVETAIRVRRHVDTLPQQGATRAELVAAVFPDAYARSRNDTTAYWKQRIGQAVDMGLRFDLIKTLTGTPSGSRYIPDLGTAEQARTLNAASITDAD